jgi:hypothetical protein
VIMHRCVEYSFSKAALVCLHLVLLNTSPASITPAVCGLLTRNVCSLLVTTQLSNDSVECIFRILKIVAMVDQDAVVAALESMLEICTAYHRVRLRTILMMLKNNSNSTSHSAINGGPYNWLAASAATGHQDMCKSFISVFGTSSKVATLHAW